MKKTPKNAQKRKLKPTVHQHQHSEELSSSTYLEAVHGQHSQYTPGTGRTDDLSPVDMESSETLHELTHTHALVTDQHQGIKYWSIELCWDLGALPWVGFRRVMSHTGAEISHSIHQSNHSLTFLINAPHSNLL